MIDSKKETQLIDAAKDGDDKSFSELCSLHKGFITKIAKKLLVKRKNSKIKVNDLVNAGNLGIFDALKNYDTQKGFTFLTYAGKWIEKAILDELKLQTGFDQDPEFQFESLDSEIEYGDGYIPKYANLEDSDAKSPDSFMKEIVKHPEAAKILEEQPKIIKKIIELYYGLDENISGKRTMKEIADELGISVKKVKSTKEDIEFQIKQSVFFDHLAY